MGALRAAAVRFGVSAENDADISMLGGSVPEAIEFLERQLGHEVDHELVSTQIYGDVLASIAHGVRAMDGAVALLESLRGTRCLAVASNGSIETVRAALLASEIPDIFDAIVALDATLRPKPAPDLYVEACSRLGVEPIEAIAIEDSVRGATSAKSAGLHVVGVGSGVNLDAVSDLMVATLRDVRLRDFIDE
jgi:HAD superfamily hydrolase (TIGR01509 family)